MEAPRGLQGHVNFCIGYAVKKRGNVISMRGVYVDWKRRWDYSNNPKGKICGGRLAANGHGLVRCSVDTRTIGMLLHA